MGNHIVDTDVNEGEFSRYLLWIRTKQGSLCKGKFVRGVPLASGSVDAAVFCLSLMGTNLSDYLCEANRVLKNGGLMKVAEVVSRFDNINSFVNKVEKLGFQLLKKTMLSKMFYLFTFRKVKNTQQKSAPEIQLKPCYYKRR
nr:hypothetical protein BaRGS_026729 [Batillaria attramentaria]